MKVSATQTPMAGDSCSFYKGDVVLYTSNGVVDALGIVSSTAGGGRMVVSWWDFRKGGFHAPTVVYPHISEVWKIGRIVE